MADQDAPCDIYVEDDEGGSHTFTEAIARTAGSRVVIERPGAPSPFNRRSESSQTLAIYDIQAVRKLVRRPASES
ncbi:hypothetical protein ACQPW3_41455 [Actinosynnema sp. CA-248983]